MNKLVFAFFCVTLLQIASALQCYSCTGPECESDTSKWEKKTCETGGAAPPANYKYSCLKLNYKDKTTSKPMVQRRCFLTEIKNGKPTLTCPTKDGEAIDCPVCQTDLCNSAPRLSFNFVAISGILMAILVPKLL